MMARGPTQRSTLIDPTSLNQRPISQNMLARSETRPDLVRRGSLGGKPLLNFDEDQPSGLTPSPGVRGARSVFGVDTLWEREMTKLKEIETREEEERRRQEAADSERLRKKFKKKKGKEKAVPQDVPVEEPIAPVAAPVLPIVPRGITKGPPPPPHNDDSESSSEHSDTDVPPSPKISAEGWHSGDSDRGVAGPVRTTGVGPRYPKRSRRRAPTTQSVAQFMGDDDSEEDMPLAATVPRAVQRATRLGLPGAEGSDSDEEKPLSQLLTRSKLLDIPPVDTGGPDLPLASAAIANNAVIDDEDEDEDDKPLGLRVSRFVPSQSQLGHVDAEDDDDQPLAFHPEQQRRTQYNMLVQHQQQMMLQAQIQQSMMFSPPSLMSSGFFGGPVLPQVMPMIPPAPASPPPGAQDTTKFGRVDRWRREIVGGGKP
jgi:hypothetical protein